MNFLGIWYSITNFFRSFTFGLIIVLGIICILALIVFAIRKMKSGPFGVIVSTIGGCLIMIPIISSFNNFVDARVESSQYSGLKSQIKLLAKEAELKQKENELLDNQIKMSNQSIEINGLNNNIRQLESAKLSVQGMEKIQELALTATNLKSTQMYTERTNITSEPAKPGWFGTTFLSKDASSHYDENLAVITHDIVAKQGVDLKEIRLSNSTEMPNTIIVSGIKPKFIGASKNIPTYELQEIRSHLVDPKNPKTELGVFVYNDVASVRQAHSFAEQKEKEFQIRLSDGLETNFLDESVIELAKKFIEIALAPLGRTIVFTNSDTPSALPLMEYIENELKLNSGKQTELRTLNTKLTETIKTLEREKNSLQ